MQLLGARSIKLVTWNASALIAVDALKRDARRAFLTQVLLSPCVCFLQEVHGELTAFEAHLPEIGRNYRIFASPGPNFATGGVATLVHKSLIAPGVACVDEVLAEGRVLAVTLSLADQAVRFVNVHNFDLQQHQLDALGVFLSAADPRPLNAVTFLAGDFNFRADGDPVISVASGAPVADSFNSSPPPPRWQRLLLGFTELADAEVTHFCRAQGTTSKIDRIFTSLPRSMLLLHVADAKVIDDPVRLSQAFLSDHAPVAAFLAPSRPRLGRELPIPPHIFQDSRFAGIFAQYRQYIDLDAVMPPTQYRLLATALREAAAHVRGLLSLSKLPSPPHRVTVLAALARAVHRQDHKVLHRLAVGCPFAARHLDTSTSPPAMRDPGAFEEAFAEAKLDALHFKASAIAPSRRPCARALRRRMALWSKSQPRALLRGVLLEGDRIADDLPSMQCALASHWARVFRDVEVERDAMLQLASVLPPLPTPRPPTKSQIRLALRLARDNAPGPDGLPASAWRAAGNLAVDHFWLTSLWLSMGHPMGPTWTGCLMLFPPKKVQPSERAVLRHSRDVRPISLKQVANKIVLAARSFSLRDSLIAWSCSAQRGFVPTRNLACNFVEADLTARLASMTCSPADRPLAVGFDIEAAFPSISRTWLWYVLTVIEMPIGLQRFFRAAHEASWAFAWQADVLTPLFPLERGVLQGCPLAGVAFVFAMDAVIRQLILIVAAAGRVFACADDLLVIIYMASRLQEIFNLFALVQRATSMRLNAKKCAFTPLWGSFSLSLRERVGDALARYAPAWRSSRIVAFFEFLGLPFGPGATAAAAWDAPLAKLRQVTASIVASGCAPSLAIALFNARAAPTLTYIGQFWPAPPSLRRLELELGSKLFHAPGIAFSRCVLANVAAVAKVRLTLPSALCWACLARAHAKTFVQFAGLARTLIGAAENLVEATRLFAGEPWPRFWLSPSPGARLIGNENDILAFAGLPRRERTAAVAAFRAARRSHLLALPRLQTTAFAAFVNDRFPPGDFAADFARRLAMLDPSLAGFNIEDLLAAFAVSKPHSAQCAFRTLVNAWPTQSRLHIAGVHAPRCMFGCAHGADDLARHYWSACPSLVAVVVAALGVRVDPGIVHAKWGLLPLAPCAIKLLAVLYSLYVNAARQRTAGRPIDLPAAARHATLQHFAR